MCLGNLDFAAVASTAAAEKQRDSCLRAKVRLYAVNRARAKGAEVTKIAAGSVAVDTLQQAEAGIVAVLRDSESAIVAVANGFEELARQSHGVLTVAAEIVTCVEGEGIRTLLPRVESLGDAARQFVHVRLDATAGILESVLAEVKLLDRLAHLTRGQRSIARETQTLSVLTNIEVARLGQLGAGFQYLAHELDQFSQSVTEGMKELAAHTDEHRTEVDQTRRLLAAALPRVQKDFTRIEADLENALAVTRESHSQLEHAPVQFRGTVEEISGQIAGVVAAVQGHDITRQQLEHVHKALTLIKNKMSAVEEAREQGGAGDAEKELATIVAGLAIQIYQMRSIAETVGDWVAQIGRCIENILRISSSEIVGLGPLVLEQETRLSEQLQRIEQLERECETDSEEVRGTFAGLNKLMQLVGNHVEKSRTVRDRLQLLTFNSIIEASHLGEKADAILEISQSIKRLSLDWSAMTDSSAQSKEEILALVEQAQGGMLAFSEAGSENLREAQAAAREGLENLRGVAACAGQKAEDVETTTAALQSKVSALSAARDRLDASFSAIGVVLRQIEDLRAEVEAESPRSLAHCNKNAMEELFGSSYTTEIEREVMRAALHGAPLPRMQQNLAGNDCELF